MKPPDNRVLMLLENQAYPQDHRVRREALALARAGYRVSVVCPATRAQVRHEVVDGVRVYRFRSPAPANGFLRSEEHTSELQSHSDLVCRLLLEKKKKKKLNKNQ